MTCLKRFSAHKLIHYLLDQLPHNILNAVVTEDANVADKLCT